jgi:hypothetical protein
MENCFLGVLAAETYWRLRFIASHKWISADREGTALVCLRPVRSDMEN